MAKRRSSKRKSKAAEQQLCTSEKKRALVFKKLTAAERGTLDRLTLKIFGIPFFPPKKKAKKKPATASKY